VFVFYSTGADFVFLPEKPPTDDDWETAMCDRLARVCIRRIEIRAYDSVSNQP
jgi:hypothetical protein